MDLLISDRLSDLEIVNKKENLLNCGLCCLRRPQTKLERI